MSQNNSKYHTFENTTEYIENDDIISTVTSAYGKHVKNRVV
jgi:hypothetical protein